MPDIQQLVVVIIVGLEHNKFRQNQNGQPAAVQPALLEFGMEKCRDQQQVDKADVFDVEPEIIVFQGAVILPVDPVQMQPQHVLPVQRLGKHGVPHFYQPDHAAHQGKPSPWGKHGLGAGAANQGVHPARQADQHQRQCAVGVHQWQGQNQQGEIPPKPGFLLHTEPPDQIQCGKQHTPAKQGGPLWNQQIHDGGDPDDVFGSVVGGGGVKPGKDAGKRLGAAKEIHKPEPAAHKEQPKSQASFARAAQHLPRQLPHHAVHADECGQHGQQVSGAGVCPQHQKNAGNGLAQKWVAEPVLAAQQGIHRRQLAGNGNVFDESQVHRHIAIAALPGVITAVYQMQHMGVQQVQGNNSQG